MMPSRLHYSMARGGQMYAADAELQTDVMRFMAILSLCLVAIFALVQSIPVTPRTAEQPRASTAPVTPPVTLKEPRAEAIVPVTVSKRDEPVAPVKMPLREQAIGPVTSPARKEARPEPDRMATSPAEPQATAGAATRQPGFTLQFEDNEALTRLISRDAVGFFAISAEKSLRLKVGGGRMDFWPSSTPGQYYEMDGATVPAEVRTALLRSGADFAGSQLWGVTLPPATTAKLREYLAGTGGGRLIIGRNGDLRLEQ